MFKYLNDITHDLGKIPEESLRPEPAVYSLEAIIALQKALVGGLPAELNDGRHCHPANSFIERRKLKERRKMQRPSVQGIEPSPRVTLARILRQMLTTIIGSDQPASGRSARNLL